jgi:peptide/nickel transport system substrate-binding protein
MTPSRRRSVLSLAAALLLAAPAAAPAQTPAGEVTVSFHVTVTPAWLDPSTAPPQITPFGVLYAVHDALVRPLPGQKMAPSLAESWTESPDGLVYEFRLRRGLLFHNGDPVTAEDVKFSYDRYKGAGAREFQARVQRVEVVDSLRVRFHLKQAWPDFMTFYGTTATAAGLVVPKKYIEQVGEDGFRQRPVGAGPYKFVSHAPGVELVLEAYPGYWRHAPYVKRYVMKSITDSTSRLAALKSGQLDMAYFLDGPEAEVVKKDPRLTLVDAARFHLLDRVRRSVGPEVAVGRPAPAAGGQSLARPQVHQRGGLRGLLPARGRHRAAGDGVRAAGGALPL